MSVLIYAEVSNGKLAKNAFESINYGAQTAKKLGTDAIAVVLGEASDASNAGKYGVTKVLNYTGDAFKNLVPEYAVAAMADAIEKTGSDVIVFPHDYTGKAIAPMLAAKLDAGLVSGAVDLPDTSNGFVVKKAVFSGKAFAHTKINTDKKIISVLPNSIGKSVGEGSAEVETVSFDVSGISTTYTVKEVKKESGEISLTEADIVVSAGRGLKGPENWGMIEELAKVLGAATACSRPVADIGWRPHHEHVGQTGIAIRPNLYIAIGISGAIQHLAGVNGSKTIVVINTDPEAPFFKACDYGIVGDAFEVVPKLIEAFKKFKAENQ
jgi:electron transfer flavoprotein alpha subunit